MNADSGKWSQLLSGQRECPAGDPALLPLLALFGFVSLVNPRLDPTR